MLNICLEKCFGCMACKNICPKKCISFIQNKEGFLYPIINQEQCVNCGLCQNVCPIVVEPIIEGQKECYAIINKDEKVRENSVSGGIFSALSDFVLGYGGVVYGVIYDDEFNARHVRATSSEERNKMSGSKYIQSDIGDVFSFIAKDLQDGLKVLFTGTSCQVDGLNRFIQAKKINDANLYSCEIVCHGVPSPLIFKEHVRYLERKRKKKIVSYKNRSKIKGWHEHNEQIFYEDGKVEWKTKSAQNFKDLFYKNLILRDNCYTCPYAGKMGVADIAIGDFWGVQNILPKIDDDKGVSILMLSSQKGKALFEQIKDKVYYYEVKNEDALKYNHNKPCKVPLNRDDFWQDYFKYGYDYVAKKYAGDTFLGRIKFFIKTRLRRVLVFLHLKDK